MDLGTVFKLSVYSLTALVGAILGASEGEGGTNHNQLVLPFLSLPIVAVGFLFTERRQGSLKRGGGLNAHWANLLGIVALVATAYEFFSENREGKLLAGTHLLLYATWIVLFQQKTVRLYWFLMALGILQLAVASVLTTKGWFGFCAIAYMFSAVWTLSIFSLWRAEQFFDEENQRVLDEGLASPPAVGLAATRELQSEVRGAVQHEDGTRWLTVRFVTGVLMTTCSALVVSAAFFIFIPRLWVGADISLDEHLDSSTSEKSRKTELAKTVRLGDFSSILESLEPVFEIRLFNIKTGRTMTAQQYADQLGMAEPLFRGNVLTEYQRGRWTADLVGSSNILVFERPAAEIDVRQEIRLEPTSSDVLYCLGVPVSISDSRHNPFGDLNELTCVASTGERRNETVVTEYAVSTVLPTKYQLNYRIPVSPYIRLIYKRSDYLTDITVKLPGGLNRLKELTHQILDKEIVRRQLAEMRETPRKLTQLEIATALESYLRDSGGYEYSLEMSTIDSMIDPIEDFLFNRKKGHCEYFATALALMLREARIPARVVTGYKGGLAHPTKKDTLLVQQRFAHLWVEAWVDKDGWTTFDATPAAARSDSIASVSAKKSSLWAGVQTTLSGLWTKNILNMNLDRQEESIYKPLREFAFAFLAFVQQFMMSPTAALQTFWTQMTTQKSWSSFAKGAFASITLIFLLGMIWLLRGGIKWMRNWLTDLIGRKNRQRRRAIEFYDRFVRLMNSKGLTRSSTETQHEFAEQVASAYSPELQANGLDDTPDQISRLYYQVRFGDDDLSDADLNQVQILLGKLEDALSNDSSHAKVQDPIGAT